MKAFLSLIATLALSYHAEGRGMKPRLALAATSTPPSSAVISVTCNGKSAYNYGQAISVNASCTTQTFYINTKSSSCTTLLDLYNSSVLNLLHCPFPEFNVINDPVFNFFLDDFMLDFFIDDSMHDVFFIKHFLLQLFLVEHPLHNFFFFIEHSLLNFFYLVKH
ncbi:hypothetical protein M436DRAFT_83374 [Aureobasidium namibiae CBS 147.97]|uniref:Uncharacterized protein n=1 Tax=Aureobasidium namibiae CBS 147.97 TaxID=1043004 RepID=A0A074WFG4_9PEZI